MVPPEQVPATLAQLLARPSRKAKAASTAPSVEARSGQFGFDFEEAPVVEAQVPVEDAKPAGVAADREASAAVPEPERQRKLWTVAELVGVLRGRLEREYADVWVEGEISNCRAASSGHLYFTLKDGDAQLPVVLFRRQAGLLRWRPEDGLAVLVRGRVSVFENRGQLQLIAETMEPRGAGALQVRFEQLKAKLREEGLFDAERKRALPAFPKRIGVITSVQGAVIRDIVNVCRRRHGCMDILVYPAAVQGASAAAELAAGVRYFNRTGQHRVDVILLARGGGSAEDLWAFNDEALARAIAASDLAVVSAVGHETDFTIADFVADLRAPTPSAAAELITAAQHRVEEHIQTLQLRLTRGIRFQVITARQKYSHIAADGVLRRIRDTLGRRQQQVDEAALRLARAKDYIIQQRRERVRKLNERLLRQEIPNRITEAQHRLQSADALLRRAATTMLAANRERSNLAATRLNALSPQAILDRGYSLTFLPDGRLLRSVTQVSPRVQLHTRLADGTVISEVKEAQEKA